MSEAGKPSPVEAIKDQSRFLAGEIGPEMADANDHFGKTSEVLKNAEMPSFSESFGRTFAFGWGSEAIRVAGKFSSACSRTPR